MSITISVDYGNGASKTFGIDDLPEQPVGDVLSLWDVLAAVRDIPPGLEYVFSDGTSASDRGGLSFEGKLISVDAVAEESFEWLVFINDKPVTTLRRAKLRMADHREQPRVQDGDAVLIKFVRQAESD